MFCFSPHCYFLLVSSTHIGPKVTPTLHGLYSAVCAVSNSNLPLALYQDNSDGWSFLPSNLKHRYKKGIGIEEH